MAKRHKPQTPLQPLLIIDDRNKPDEAWIPANLLPDMNCYGWSEPALVCQFETGDMKPSIMVASYDFDRRQWRTAMGEVENVTHWQPLPDCPKEYLL